MFCLLIYNKVKLDKRVNCKKNFVWPFFVDRIECEKTKA